MGHIGRYDLLQRLGRGGMAEVYLARPQGDPRSVVYALKCILPHFADDPRFVQMFHRELKIAGGLCHPNLVSVLDHGRDAGRHFMVMEYVHGPDLSKLLRASGEQDVRPPLGAALSVVIAAARGLHHLHDWPGPHGGAPGFVHRDVSPSNVLVGYDGAVKVTDFGVATATAHTRTTDAGGVKGKMGYLSPEQCRSEAMDRRSDVFALGVLLYETTLGERLFYAENDYAVMHQIVSGEYDRPSERDPRYSSALESIVLTALASDRQDRFDTAAALADALEAFAERHQVVVGTEVLAAWVASLIPWEPYPAFLPPPAALPTPTATPAYVPPPPPRPRHRVPLIAAAVGIPLALAGLIAGSLLTGGAVEVEEKAPPAVASPAVASPAPVQTAPVAQAPPATDAPPLAPAPVDPATELDPVEVVDDAPEDVLAPAPGPRRRKGRRRKKARSRAPRYDLDAPRPPQ